MKENKAVTKATVEEFVRLFSAAGAALLKASQVLVELVAADENCFENIIRAYPGVTYDTLYSLYQCGRIGLDPRAMIANPIAARALLTLPEKDAKEVVEKGLPVVDRKSRDKEKAVLKRIEQVTAKEAKTAIVHGRIRSANEQAEALEKTQHAQLLRYTIAQDGKVTFTGRCSFSAGELADIAREAMQASLKSLAKLNNQVA